MKLFITEFQDLEDDAINAVYDLCEDQDPRVRLSLLLYGLFIEESQFYRCVKMDTVQ